VCFGQPTPGPYIENNGNPTGVGIFFAGGKGVGPQLLFFNLRLKIVIFK